MRLIFQRIWVAPRSFRPNAGGRIFCFLPNPITVSRNSPGARKPGSEYLSETKSIDRSTARADRVSAAPSCRINEHLIICMLHSASHPQAHPAHIPVERYRRIQTARRQKNLPKLTKSYQILPRHHPNLVSPKVLRSFFKSDRIPHTNNSN